MFMEICVVFVYHIICLLQVFRETPEMKKSNTTCLDVIDYRKALLNDIIYSD